MLNLTCALPECGKPFEVQYWRLYCDACVTAFREDKKKIRAAQNPGPGLILVHSVPIVDKVPQTGTEPVTGLEVCGLCGSSDVGAGYGIGTGYGGIGGYKYCGGCSSFLSFVEDNDE